MPNFVQFVPFQSKWVQVMQDGFCIMIGTVRNRDLSLQMTLELAQKSIYIPKWFSVHLVALKVNCY